jgi:cytochrome P450
VSATATTQAAGTHNGGAAAPTQRLLPPGPRLPRIIQTAGFMAGGARFLEWARRRYGGAVYMQTVFDEGFVMLFDPDLVKELFQGPHEQLNAGEANALLGPILGERSVLLLDGSEHLRHRRLMLPPFHGRRMQAYAETMQEAVDAEIDGWPVGREFELMPSLQAVTLRVIMRAVFGFEPGPAEDELRRRLREMIAPVARPRGLVLMFTLGRLGRRTDAVQRFEAAKRAVDEILYAEIARRRQADDLAERDDVFSALLLAEDEHGERLTDREVRDELVTLLIAGHETTATGLAWTFDLLLHSPAVLERCDPADPAYLDAVVKESLRLRPVIPGVGRVVRREPFRIGEYEVPIGMEINPSIRVIHRRGDLYPEPAAFRPERFLGENPPDTYTWVPFGGGTRRCLGASFALMEMRIVLSRVLERCSLRAASTTPEKVQFRGITLAPKGAVRVVQERNPAPGSPAPAVAGV